jgi:hypothetical protein
VKNSWPVLKQTSPKVSVKLITTWVNCWMKIDGSCRNCWNNYFFCITDHNVEDWR